MTGAVQASAIGFYDRSAAEFARRYDSVTFEQVHRILLPFLPRRPSAILDVGAGSGRDARALAALGHRVTAVEPAAALRDLARAASPGIEWVDDRLPSLASLERSHGQFRFILCSAVLMSLAAAELGPSLATMTRLLSADGRLAIYVRDPLNSETWLTRHGEGAILAAARNGGLGLVRQWTTSDALGRGIPWRTYVFEWLRPAQPSGD